jgi:Eukaryotic aspartyl protease
LGDQQSELTLGGYNEEAFAQGEQLVAHPVSGSFHWSIHIVRFSIAGKEILGSASQALIDSGSTQIHMNKSNGMRLNVI